MKEHIRSLVLELATGGDSGSGGSGGGGGAVVGKLETYLMQRNRIV